MKTALALLLLVLQGTPQDEYKTKLAALSKSTAAKHYGIGDYLAGAQMHLWAREQFYKVIEFDPDHENARRKLGFKKNADGEWESDPTSKQEFGNKKKGEDAERVRKQYVDRQDQAGKDLSRQWGDLALFCKKNKLDAESAAAFMKALEYDPANASARKELGYEKDAKGVWMSKVERELRKEMKEGIAKAPNGASAGGESDVESALSLKTKKRESEHFLIESPHLKDEQMGAILQNAEHAYAMFHKVFSAPDTYDGRRSGLVVLKDKAQHTAYITAFYKAEPEHVKLAMEAQAHGGYPRSETYQATLPDAYLLDWSIHVTVHSLLRTKYCWLVEGMALHFTRLMKETAMLQCIDLAGTSPRNRGKNYTDVNDWPVVCRVWVREGKDPDLTAILKRTNFGEFDGADAVKAWSLVEFLLGQHRDKFSELITALKAGKDVEAALKEIWGWTINDLDFRWKQYVKVAY